jgi:hypothetical protein
MPKIELESISGLSLAYALLEAEGTQLFGPPTGPFAYLSGDKTTLHIICEDREEVDFLDQAEFDQAILQYAQGRNAAFLVRKNEVTCVIGNLSAAGASYAEAAARVLLAVALRN